MPSNCAVGTLSRYAVSICISCFVYGVFSGVLFIWLLTQCFFAAIFVCIFADKYTSGSQKETYKAAVFMAV